MAKNLKDILAGSKSSKEVTPDLKNLAMSPEGNKGELDFAAKHKIEKHADRVGNDDKVYTGGTSKTTKYKFQKDGVYEETLEELTGRGKLGESETKCNHTGLGVMCELHGKDQCPPGIEPKDVPKFGQKVLLDKKSKIAEGRVEDVAHKKTTKELAALAAASNKPVTKLKPGKKDYNQLKSTGQMFGGARSFIASLSKRDIEAGGDKRGSSVGRATVKEEDIQEVAPPNPKIEKWIKANKERFIKEYGKEKGTQVLYAKAWKMHGQSESGTSSPATNSDYAGPGAAGWTTGRLDVGTL